MGFGNGRSGLYRGRKEVENGANMPNSPFNSALVGENMETTMIQQILSFHESTLSYMLVQLVIHMHTK